MSRKDYIGKKIVLLKESIKSFNRWSVILFFISILSILIPFIFPINNLFTTEFLKFGLSSFFMLSSAALQGVKYCRKNKLVELEYCLDLVEQYETLQEFDKHIINNALDGNHNNL